ncbi:unnamed protein product [Rotaria sordida]|uniref:Glucosidase 2 subunit beta n=1 Tax=Rotaria sordida TaxID=392033 RepID=A0A814D2D5_9BILA|nr:unnamed protein product [Rotaria sordida]
MNMSVESSLVVDNSLQSNGNIQQTVLRGVQTSLLSMYIPSKPFTCLDGSLTIPFEFVNDDYCDCQDGSDEPGTSACPNGQFFCENKGYFGTLIPSHFVGDGVCDCCDGSDEYETTIVCNNTCFASHSSSHSLILNLTNNLIFYQTIFNPVFSNKNKKTEKLKNSKHQSSKVIYNATKTYSQHGLLIDKYLDKTINDENYTNDYLFSKKYSIQFLCIFCFINLIELILPFLFSELAQKFQASRDAQRALHAAGVEKKKQILASTTTNKSGRQFSQKYLDELEQALKILEKELKEKEELKRQAEILENAAKEKHKKLCEEKRTMQDVSLRNNQMHEMFADLDTNGDSLISIDELQKHTELDTNQQNEFTIEEVRSILGSDSVNLNEFNTTVFDQISNSYRQLPEPTRPTPEPTPLPEPSIDSMTTQSPSLETFIDEEDLITHTRSSYKYEDEDDYEEDHHRESKTLATSIEHEKHIHDSVAPEYDDETKKLMEIAEEARNRYHEIEEKFLSIKRQIEDLKKQSTVDAGPHDEYSPIIDQCFDYEEREYTYRICMFKTAKQISKGGGSEVIIGYWDSWCGPKDNKYLKMKYSNGATCWNGPPRSLIVTLQCGIEQKLTDVREPSRCEYTIIFETPLACDENIATTSLHSDHVEF